MRELKSDWKRYLFQVVKMDEPDFRGLCDVMCHKQDITNQHLLLIVPVSLIRKAVGFPGYRVSSICSSGAKDLKST